MIDVSEREQKKVRGYDESRKAVIISNRQSAGKFLSSKMGKFHNGIRKSFNDYKGVSSVASREKNIGVVYLIENLINGKKYVGKTFSNFGQRIAQHLNNLNKYELDSSLYKAMRKDGLENFNFRILEFQADPKALVEAETKYISKLDAIDNGYNQVLYGNQRLSKESVSQIQDLLLNTNKTMKEISSFFGVDESTISDINLGRSWRKESLCYPLAFHTRKRKKLTNKDILTICQLLEDSQISIQEIAQMYGYKSESVIRKINDGTYNIKLFSDLKYPLRKIKGR